MLRAKLVAERAHGDEIHGFIAKFLAQDENVLVECAGGAAPLRDGCGCGRARIRRNGDVLGNACRDGGGHATRPAALRLFPAHQRVFHGATPSARGKLACACAFVD